MFKQNTIIISQVVRESLTIVEQEIADDGVLGCSGTGTDFVNDIVQRTTFCTALVLGSLMTLSDGISSEIIKQCTKFLQAQRHPDGSYNYWQIGSPESVARKCPNDLDDTALATAALWQARPELADGVGLARVTQLLISAETAPSGPYKTWLGASVANAEWQDIDVAVNANISWMLSLQGIQLPGLQAYLSKCIADSDYVSRYYVDAEAIYYFLSRTSGGKESLLGKIVERLDEICESKNALRMAFGLCALLRCGANHETVDRLAAALYATVQSSGFRPEPICFDAVREGIQSTTGSTAVTAALIAEAFHAYLRCGEGQPEYEEEIQAYRRELRQMLDSFIATQPALLARQLAELSQKTISNDTNGEIQMIAYVCAELFPTDKRMTIAQRAMLGLASLLGWIAYAIYDDVMDDQKDIAYMPLAHSCAREVQKIYAEVASKEAMTFITRIFSDMDNANALEFLKPKSPLVQELDWSLLANRSMGHALAVLIQVTHAGYSEESSEFQAIITWFRHYVTARQLHDDAHDWEEDLARGSMTYPVRLVSVHLAAGRKEFFLLECVPKISEKILEHLQYAENAISLLPLNPEPLMKFSNSLRAGAHKAIHEAQELQPFINAMGLQKVPC